MRTKETVRQAIDSLPDDAFSILRRRAEKLWIDLFPTGSKRDPIQSLSMDRRQGEFYLSEHKDLVEGRPEDVLRHGLKCSRQIACETWPILNVVPAGHRSAACGIRS